MSRIRSSNPEDQLRVDRVLDLLETFFEANKIDGVLMSSAMMSYIAANFEGSGHSYEEYQTEMIEMTKFYKRYWDDSPL